MGSHKDFLGRELAVGDEVVVTPKNYRGLIRATVVKMTSQKVRLAYKNTWNFGKPGVDEEYLVWPTDVVKI